MHVASTDHQSPWPQVQLVLTLHFQTAQTLLSRNGFELTFHKQREILEAQHAFL